MRTSTFFKLIWTQNTLPVPLASKTLLPSSEFLLRQYELALYLYFMSPQDILRLPQASRQLCCLANICS